ncbi:VQ motif-containing protein [Rhynchospora pubera]|uniref:VQ motif-containing protein n=1 Tax=Rhynchospora pubera TaxID=906938 RepID=A0AAV8GYJ3_9POAL|nr:VQ motif-containing protein [Rhynchospora pubera]
MSSSKLKGPRPTPLMVSTDSHKVQKAAKKPVIIYMVAPEIIHVEAGEFMSLVQRLTGPNSPSPGKIRNLTSNNDQTDGKDKNQFPVKVKARVLNHAASSTKQQLSPQSPMSPTLFFHDLSPLSRGSALKEAAAASQGWLHHADFLGHGNGLPSSGGLGSPTFLDIFGSIPPAQP